MSIVVHKAEDAYKAAAEFGPRIFTIRKKADGKTYKGGTIFLNAIWTINARRETDGWFSATNIILTNGVADPKNTLDIRTEYEKVRLQLQTSVSKAGLIGKFLEIMNHIWTDTIKEMINNKSIDYDGQKIHELVQTKLSKKNVKNPCGPIEDPIIRFKIDFEPFPQKYKYKFLAGQPRTQIYDYNKSYTDDNGVKQYRMATVPDPLTGDDVLVNKDNIHLFVTPGSVIKYIRFTINSVVVSQLYISMPMIAQTVVIEPGPPEGFSDTTVIHNIIEGLETITADNNAEDQDKIDPISITVPAAPPADLDQFLENI